MKFTGDATCTHPVEQVWDALLDPAVLVATIPGCERLEATGENAYAMTVTAGVAAIKGTYAGSCELSDLAAAQLAGDEAAGRRRARHHRRRPSTSRFADDGDGTTTVAYDADAVVGGMVGGVGQRMLTSVSRRMAGEFFGNVDGVLTGRPRWRAPPRRRCAAGAVSRAVAGCLHRPGRRRRGVALPGRLPQGHRSSAPGWCCAGVVVGGLFGRRR